MISWCLFQKSYNIAYHIISQSRYDGQQTQQTTTTTTTGLSSKITRRVKKSSIGSIYTSEVNAFSASSAARTPARSFSARSRRVAFSRTSSRSASCCWDALLAYDVYVIDVFVSYMPQARERESTRNVGVSRRAVSCRLRQ